MTKSDTKTDSPFSSGDPRTNARVGIRSGARTCYAYGYYLAGENLTSNLKRDDFAIDLQVYPICYVFRHALELQLKGLITTARKYFDEETTSAPGHHKIMDLWNLAKGYVRRADPDRPDPEQFLSIDTFLKEFTSLDYDAQSFRFATDSKGNASFVSESQIDLQKLQAVTKDTFFFIGGCDDWLHECLDAGPDWS